MTPQPKPKKGRAPAATAWAVKCKGQLDTSTVGITKTALRRMIRMSSSMWPGGSVVRVTVTEAAPKPKKKARTR